MVVDLGGARWDRPELVDGIGVVPEGTDDALAARRLLERDGAVVVPRPDEDPRSVADGIARWLFGSDVVAAPGAARVPGGSGSPPAGPAVPLHVDGLALGRHRPDVVALTCEAAGVGGRSVLVDAVAAVEAMGRDPRCEALHHLATVQLVDLAPSGQAPEPGRILVRGPGGRPQVRLSPDLRPLPGDPDGARTAARIDRWASWWADVDAGTPGFALAPGDVLVIDNHRMAHGRTASRDEPPVLWCSWAWTRFGAPPPPDVVAGAAVVPAVAAAVAPAPPG